MPLQQSAIDKVNEISLEPRPRGLQAVFVIDVRSRKEGQEVSRLFAELEAYVQVRQLSKGRLLGYALQTRDADSTVIDTVEEVLRESFKHVVVQRSWDASVLRLVKDLCTETHSIFLPPPRCDICGSAEPFPATVVNLSNGLTSPKISRSYCAKCSTDAEASTNKQLVRSLLGADDRRLGRVAQSDLERKPTHGRRVRFVVKNQN